MVCDTEEFDDIKGVNRIRKPKDTNDQKKKGQHDLQNITQKTEDRVTRTPLSTGGGEGGKMRFSGRVSKAIPALLVVTIVIYREYSYLVLF